MKHWKMKNFAGPISLRQGIILCVMLAILYSACMLSFYTFSFQHTYQEQIRSTFNGLSQNIENRLQENMEQLSDISRSLSYSFTVQIYLLSSNKVEAIQADKAAQEIMSVYLASNRLASNIILIADNQRSLYGNALNITGQMEERLGFENTESPKEYLWQQGGGLARNETDFSPVLFRSYGQESIPYAYFLFAAGGILPETAGSSAKILCAVSCDLEELLGLRETWIPQDTVLLLTDGDHLLWSNQELSPLLRRAALSGHFGQGELTADGRDYLVNTLPLTELSCNMVWMIPKSAVDNASLWAMFVSAMLCLCGGGVLILFMAFLLRSLSSPLITMQREMKELDGRARHRLSLPRLREFRELAREINYMLQRIEEANQREISLQNRLYNAALLQNRTQLQFYQKQINPHVLFNTLESIRSMSHHYQVQPIERIVSAMGKIFRYSVYAGVTSPLKSELQHVQDYFTVMEMRTAERCRLILCAEENALDYPILSMTLQPIVENAFQYGFSGSRKKFWTILLEAKLLPTGALRLRVTDNGRGISPASLERLRVRIKKGTQSQGASRHIGLTNIYQRFYLAFGEGMSMEISSREGFYTQVELLVPKRLSDPPFPLPSEDKT